MERAVFANLGAESGAVVVGPGQGLDNAVVRVGNSRVMVITTDPVSIVPALGVAESAWLSVNLIASDYATSALRPEYASFNFNLPAALGASDAETYLRSVGEACRELGVTIIAGHTGTYPGAGYTVVGGGTMFGFGREDGYLTPAMAKEGDIVLMTKGAAIEATATLAGSFPRFLESRLPGPVLRRARDYWRLCSTVRDSLVASSIGIRQDGITMMHDATEGGVLGALAEVSNASDRKIEVNVGRIHVTEETRAVCAAFGIDPLKSLSEGTLLITCRPEKVNQLLRKLRRSAIEAFEIGEARGNGRALRLIGNDGTSRAYVPRVDPFWKAYNRASASNLA